MNAPIPAHRTSDGESVGSAFSHGVRSDCDMTLDDVADQKLHLPAGRCNVRARPRRSPLVLAHQSDSSVPSVKSVGSCCVDSFGGCWGW